jgi:hypothetical protein
MYETKPFLTKAPYPDCKMVSGPREVQAHTCAKVFINNSQRGVDYQLYNADSHTPVGKAVLSEMEGEKIVFLTDPISRTASFYVIATKQLSAMGCSRQMENKVTIHTEEENGFGLKAKVKEGVVMLTWKAKTPEGGERFEILRSEQNGEFALANTLKGKGISSVAKEYMYTDRLAKKGLNKYRIRQVNVEAVAIYSAIVEVELESNNVIQLQTAGEL